MLKWNEFLWIFFKYRFRYKVLYARNILQILFNNSILDKETHFPIILVD